MKNKVTQLAPRTMMTQAPRKFFSSPVASGPGYGTMALIGMGTGGLAYLSYRAH